MDSAVAAAAAALRDNDGRALRSLQQQSDIGHRTRQNPTIKIPESKLKLFLFNLSMKLSISRNRFI